LRHDARSSLTSRETHRNEKAAMPEPGIAARSLQIVFLIAY
jgi:hypothetical protein